LTELGGTLIITADNNSTKYQDKIKKGLIDTNNPMLTVSPGTGNIDAVDICNGKILCLKGA